MKITTETYLTFIRNAIKTEGIHTTDIANKMALEMKTITIDQYSAAARILVDAYLNRAV